MHSNHRFLRPLWVLILLLGAAMLAQSGVMIVHAAESPSYRLEEAMQERTIATSEHFRVEGVIGWIEEKPFQGITAFLVSNISPFLSAVNLPPPPQNSGGSGGGGSYVQYVPPPHQYNQPPPQQQPLRPAPPPKPEQRPSRLPTQLPANRGGAKPPEPTKKETPKQVTAPRPVLPSAKPARGAQPAPQPSRFAPSKPAPFPSKIESPRAKTTIPARVQSPVPARAQNVVPARAQTVVPARAQGPERRREALLGRIGASVLGAAGRVLPATIWLSTVALGILAAGRLRRTSLSAGRLRRTSPPAGRRRNKPRVAGRVRGRQRGRALFPWIASLLLFAFASHTLPARAAMTAPPRHAYSGRLLAPNGVPLTQQHAIRFSYWRIADAVTSDLTGSGTINLFSPNYAGWSEVHAVTPDPSGSFSVQLGSLVPLPDLSAIPSSTLLGLHLQVEVKPIGAANTAYELLDPNVGDAAVDRSPILSVPFARNADLLDQREIGTGSGSIPLLGHGGVLPAAMMPGGTGKETFSIDADNTGTGSVALMFGQSLTRALSFNVPQNRFEFSSSVRIQGDLTVTGSVNGIDMSTLSGSIAVVRAFQPSFEGASYEPDGSNNVGQLLVDHDGSTQRNFYQWTSTRSGMQDYDVLLRVPLPPRFQRWRAEAATNPLSVSYRSGLTGTGSNKLDVTVYDSNGVQAALSGALTNLTNTAWTTAQSEFLGTPAWTPGGSFLMRMRMAAKAGGRIDLGNIQLQWLEARN